MGQQDIGEDTLAPSFPLAMRLRLRTATNSPITTGSRVRTLQARSVTQP